MVTRALVRSIPSTFADALTMHPKQQPIDVELAQRQHRLYGEALTAAGLEVERLPSDDSFPDGCFVEDCAIVAEGTALITRPGAPSRRSEVDSVATALGRALRIERTAEPATIDGGDCMRVGRRIFVGRSARTNEQGIARVKEVFAPLGFEVVGVALRDVLHLKCVCSPLDDNTILLAEGTIPGATFGDVRVIAVPGHEQYGANAVAMGQSVLVSAGHPTTERRLREAGFVVTTLDTSEIRKADGALTCMSVLY